MAKTKIEDERYRRAMDMLTVPQFARNNTQFKGTMRAGSNIVSPEMDELTRRTQLAGIKSQFKPQVPDRVSTGIKDIDGHSLKIPGGWDPANYQRITNDFIYNGNMTPAQAQAKANELFTSRYGPGKQPAATVDTDQGSLPIDFVLGQRSEARAAANPDADGAARWMSPDGTFRQKHTRPASEITGQLENSISRNAAELDAYQRQYDAATEKYGEDSDQAKTLEKKLSHGLDMRMNLARLKGQYSPADGQEVEDTPSVTPRQIQDATRRMANMDDRRARGLDVNKNEYAKLMKMAAGSDKVTGSDGQNYRIPPGRKDLWDKLQTSKNAALRDPETFALKQQLTGGDLRLDYDGVFDSPAEKKFAEKLFKRYDNISKLVESGRIAPQAAAPRMLEVIDALNNGYVEKQVKNEKLASGERLKQQAVYHDRMATQLERKVKSATGEIGQINKQIDKLDGQYHDLLKFPATKDESDNERNARKQQILDTIGSLQKKIEGKRAEVEQYQGQYERISGQANDIYAKMSGIETDPMGIGRGSGEVAFDDAWGADATARLQRADDARGEMFDTEWDAGTAARQQRAADAPKTAQQEQFMAALPADLDKTHSEFMADLDAMPGIGQEKGTDFPIDINEAADLAMQMAGGDVYKAKKILKEKGF